MIKKPSPLLLFLLAHCMGLIIPQWTRAQTSPREEIYRLLIVLNTDPQAYSGEGNVQAGLREASRFIKTLVDSLYQHNAEVELALAATRTPVQAKALDPACSEASRLVPFSRDNRAQIGLRLDDVVHSRKAIQAWELTSLQHLMKPDPRYRYRWILLTPKADDCHLPRCARSSTTAASIPKEKLLVYFPQEGADCPGEWYAVGFDDHKGTVSRIIRQYPRLLESPEVRFGGQTQQRAREAYFPPPPGSSPPTSPSSPPITAPVAEDDAPEEPAIRFTKGSKMRSSDVYGTIQFQISRPIPVIYLFKKVGDNFQPDQEVFPLGLRRLKVQLAPGTYRALYHPEGLGWNKEFEVREGEVIGIWLR